LKALLVRLRKVSKATWLLVHDADDAECWLDQGFRVLDPPADVPPDEALLVMEWGELPEDAAALLKARGLSWHLATHRGYDPKSTEDPVRKPVREPGRILHFPVLPTKPNTE
jgi:hypothetical protein